MKDEKTFDSESQNLNSYITSFYLLSLFSILALNKKGREPTQQLNAHQGDKQIANFPDEF